MRIQWKDIKASYSLVCLRNEVNALRATLKEVVDLHELKLVTKLNGPVEKCKSVLEQMLGVIIDWKGYNGSSKPYLQEWPRNEREVDAAIATIRSLRATFQAVLPLSHRAEPKSQTLDGNTVILIDSPGFDDKDKTDSDILGGIAHWLCDAYYMGSKLFGIVYLHPIQRPRGGSDQILPWLSCQWLCKSGSPKFAGNSRAKSARWSPYYKRSKSLLFQAMREALPFVAGFNASAFMSSYYDAASTRGSLESCQSLLVLHGITRNDQGGYHSLHVPCHDTSWFLGLLRNLDLVRKENSNSTSTPCTRLIMSILNETGPATLISATVIYILMGIGYWVQHEQDTHKLKFTAGGGAAAFVFGIILDIPAQGIVVDLMPWCILVGMVVSSVYHFLARKMLERDWDTEKGDITVDIGKSRHMDHEGSVVPSTACL